MYPGKTGDRFSVSATVAGEPVLSSRNSAQPVAELPVTLARRSSTIAQTSKGGETSFQDPELGDGLDLQQRGDKKDPGVSFTPGTPQGTPYLAAVLALLS